MADEGYTSSVTWETDHSELQSHSGHRPTLRSLDSAGSSSPHLKSFTSLPRTSTDSAGPSQWRDSPTMASERRDTLASLQGQAEAPTLVEPNFDESVLRTLCDLDCGVPLLLDRIKQSLVSCREASTFFKKRAAIEEDYGKTLQKLARSTSDAYALGDGKAGSYVAAWQTTLRVHEMMAENRLRFSQRLNEMSDELAILAKEIDKNRKQTKELASRFERALQESEVTTEKSKSRLQLTSEELERLLLQKEGESVKDNITQPRASGVGGKRVIVNTFAGGMNRLKGKNNIQRQEDDIRARMLTSSDQYRKAVNDTQAMRQEYFNLQLPRILRSLKECADEIDLGTQYHLTRYAFLFESIVLSDGSTLIPPHEEGLGLKATIETIDNRGDFKTFMQNYVYAHGSAIKGPRRDVPADGGLLLSLSHHQSDKSLQGGSPNGTNSGHQDKAIQDKGRPTFGVDLAEQMARDNVEVPLIVQKCCEALEKYGIRSIGIYRISGTARKVAELRQRLDKDLESVDLDTPEWSSDINNVASALKAWLRELPDPLLTGHLHQGFMDAAKIENERLRHIRLHERVNELPDPNYATLKYFLGHLHRINQHADENQMSIQNLAIVFGPTLFGQAPVVGQQNGAAIADTPFQNQAIETILTHYTDIFIDESDA